MMGIAVLLIWLIGGVAIVIASKLPPSKQYREWEAKLYEPIWKFEIVIGHPIDIPEQTEKRIQIIEYPKHWYN